MHFWVCSWLFHPNLWHIFIECHKQSHCSLTQIWLQANIMHRCCWTCEGHMNTTETPERKRYEYIDSFHLRPLYFIFLDHTMSSPTHSIPLGSDTLTKQSWCNASCNHKIKNLLQFGFCSISRLAVTSVHLCASAIACSRSVQAASPNLLASLEVPINTSVTV